MDTWLPCPSSLLPQAIVRGDPVTNCPENSAGFEKMQEPTGGFFEINPETTHQSRKQGALFHVDL